MQAKLYAQKSQLDHSYAANGNEIYEISMKAGTEGLVDVFPTSDDQLIEMQKIIGAQKSDVFDVLEYVAFAVAPITRTDRVDGAKTNIFAFLNREQREFLDFVLSKYIETGIDELDEAKLPQLLELKYHALEDATRILGSVSDIRSTFIDFQKHLYDRKVA